MQLPKTKIFDQFAWVFLGGFLGSILGAITTFFILALLPEKTFEFLTLHLINGGNPKNSDWGDGIMLLIYAILVGQFGGCLLGMAWPLKRIYRPRRARTITSDAS